MRSDMSALFHLKAVLTERRSAGVMVMVGLLQDCHIVAPYTTDGREMSNAGKATTPTHIKPGGWQYRDQPSEHRSIPCIAAGH